jgi:hypothetical protein
MSEKNGMSAKNSSEASEENMSLEAQQTSSLPGAEAPSIVVGIGASAGGLEAIQELLKNFRTIQEWHLLSFSICLLTIKACCLKYCANSL